MVLNVLLFVAFSSISCKTKADTDHQTTNTTTKKKEPEKVDIEKVARNYFSVLGFKDLKTFNIEPWLATMADGIVMNDPYGAPPKVGKDSIRKWGEGFAQQFKSNQFTVNQVFTAGNFAAVTWTWNGVANDGKDSKFSSKGIDVLEINEKGKVKTIYGYWNPTYTGGSPKVKQAALNFFEALGSESMMKKGMEPWLNTLDVNVVSEDPVGGMVVKGKEQLQQMMQGMAGMMKSISFTVDEQYVAGNRSAIKWTANAVTKDDKKLSWQGIDVHEIDLETGLITHVLGYWDNSMFMKK